MRTSTATDTDVGNRLSCQPVRPLGQINHIATPEAVLSGHLSKMQCNVDHVLNLLADTHKKPPQGGFTVSSRISRALWQ